MLPFHGSASHAISAVAGLLVDFVLVAPLQSLSVTPLLNRLLVLAYVNY